MSEEKKDKPTVEAPDKNPNQAADPKKTSAGGGQPSLEDQLKAAVDERDTHLQNWLRAQADLDNFRKRTQKEMEQDRLYAILPLVRDLLPGFDNLHRTLEAVGKTKDLDKLVQGVQMVVKQFDDILAKNSVIAIPSVGHPFDPHLHQAVQQVPTDDKPPMTVLAEFERGYTLRDRVVRPSSVVVSAAKES